MEITWNIENLERRASDGFVTKAHWRCTATHGEHSVSVYGSCGWGEGTPVIPFTSLVPLEVLHWCWDNGVDKAEIEATLSGQIKALQNPTQLSGTPW